MGHRLDRVGFETNTETETGHLEGIDLPVFRAIGKDKSSLC
jgi:hypothetical protein